MFLCLLVHIYVCIYNMFVSTMSYLCLSLNKLSVLFCSVINFVIAFRISTSMTFELRPRQRTDYRSLHSGENIKFDNHIVKFKPVLEDTFYVDRLIWRRKYKESL